MSQESFAILKRNLDIILNAKLSFLIIFLGPVILMLVAGAILQDTSLKNLDIGIYTYNSSDLTQDDFLQGFQQNLYAGGSTVHIEQSLSDCEDRVLKMEYNACVEINKSEEYVPVQNMNFGTLKTPSYELTTHVDYSQTGSAWKIISTIQGAAEKKYSEMTQQKIDALVSQIDTIITNLGVQRDSITSIRTELASIQTNLQLMTTNLDKINNENLLIFQEASNINNKLTQLDAAYPAGIPITDQVRTSLTTIQSNSNMINAYLIGEQTDTGSVSQRLLTLDSNLADVQTNMGSVISDWNQLKQTQTSQVSTPIIYKSQSISGSAAYNVAQLGFIDYLFPSFLMFFMIFVCLIFPTNLIIRERTSNSQIRNMTSKTSGLKFGINNFLSCVLIIITQVVILLLISQFFLKADIFFKTVSILTLVVISVCILSLLGMLLGYLFNKFESAIIASISVSIIMLILLPGITPTSVLPPTISPLIKVFLPVILENKLRTLIIFGAPLSFSFTEILSMLGTLGVLVIGIIALYNKSKRKI
jgi:hypothetical protein